MLIGILSTVKSQKQKIPAKSNNHGESDYVKIESQTEQILHCEVG